MYSTVIIKFVDGSKLRIENVSTYRIDKEQKCVSVETGGFRNFFNFDQMQYICTEDCLEEGQNAEAYNANEGR